VDNIAAGKALCPKHHTHKNDELHGLSFRDIINDFAVKNHEKENFRI
jgi:hypothetical protein